VEIPRIDYSDFSENERWFSTGANARNTGLRLARGSIIAPLDDDDEFLPNHLSDCVTALTGGNFDFAYGSVVVRDLELDQDYIDYLPWQDEANRSRFDKRNIIYHSSVCYSRKYINLMYPTDGKHPADYGLWLAILEAGARFTSLEAPQAIYYGDTPSRSIRVSIPSLPPLERFHKRVEDIYESRILTNSGTCSSELEQAISDYVGVDNVLATPSGDSALILTFAAIREITPPSQNRVVLPSYTHPSTANAAIWNGFEPIFCDVDEDTLCTSPSIVAPLLSDDVAAVVVHNAHGNPCDMESFKELLGGRPLISDASSSLGADISGKRIGSFGSIEVFSLSGTKVLSAGEGGLICFEDKDLDRRIRRLATYGIGINYISEVIGINGKMAELPAALALESLPFLDEWVTMRRRAANKYGELLSSIPGIRLQSSVSEAFHSSVKDMAIVLSSPKDTQDLTQKLEGYSIQTRPYYRPLHTMPCFSHLPCGSLKNTEALADCVLCVPMYADISDQVIELVCNVVMDAVGTCNQMTHSWTT